LERLASDGYIKQCNAARTVSYISYLFMRLLLSLFISSEPSGGWATYPSTS